MERKTFAVAKSRPSKVKKANAVEKSKLVEKSNVARKANVAKKSNAKPQIVDPAEITAKQKRNQAQKMTAEQGTDEAQIAVHWKEEDWLRPPASFIAQANLVDRAFVESFGEEKFPECFRHYADLLDWEQLLAHNSGTAEPSAIFEMLCLLET